MVIVPMMTDDYEWRRLRLGWQSPHLPAGHDLKALPRRAAQGPTSLQIYSSVYGLTLRMPGCLPASCCHKDGPNCWPYSDLLCLSHEVSNNIVNAAKLAYNRIQRSRCDCNRHRQQESAAVLGPVEIAAVIVIIWHHITHADRPTCTNSVPVSPANFNSTNCSISFDHRRRSRYRQRR